RPRPPRPLSPPAHRPSFHRARVAAEVAPTQPPQLGRTPPSPHPTAPGRRAIATPDTPHHPTAAPRAGKRPRSTSIHPHVQESNMLVREGSLYYSASPIASKKLRRAHARRYPRASATT